MSKAEELREELTRLESEERNADEQRRASQSATWKVIFDNKDNWEWQVHETDYHMFDRETVKGVRVARRIKPALIEEWAKGGVARFSSGYEEKDRWFRMFYYRTDENILTSDGGGHCVLNVPKLCSDTEWEQIVSGIIPEKYR
jgi:hypothetical protein